MKNKTIPTGPGCLILIIGFILFVWMTGGFTDKRSPQEKRHEELSSEAFVVSQDFIRKHLKAPSTSQFAAQRESEVVSTDDTTFTVTSYVDAQNSFGAMIRSRYICEMRRIGENNWEMLSASIDGKKIR